jgi:hypothetical protein
MEGKIVNSWSSPDCERWTHVLLLPEETWSSPA